MDVENFEIDFQTISSNHLDLLCSRFEVDGRLHAEYPGGVRRRPAPSLKEAPQALYLKFATKLLGCLEDAFDWKFANTLVKLCESGKLGVETSEYKHFAETLVKREIIRPVHRTPTPYFEKPSKARVSQHVVPFTLLVADHAVSYAYLWALGRYGFEPEEVIVFRSANRRSKTQSFGQWVREAQSFPARQLRAQSGSLFSVADYFPRRSRRPQHSGSINDLALQEIISRSVSDTIIFSGGGILSADTLHNTGRDFLHFHPGVLPGIRGADGLFWSALLRQKAGVSGFWMREGIDTGPPFHIREYSFPIFPQDMRKAPLPILYRALLEHFDPFLRARSLIDFLLSQTSQKRALDTRYLGADASGSRQYHPMHPEIRARALRQIIG